MAKLRRWWSLRKWTNVAARAYRLLRSPQVPLRAKLLFVVPAALYWVLPDVMPGLPFDDIAVTMLLAGWFTSAMERKYPQV